MNDDELRALAAEHNVAFFNDWDPVRALDIIRENRARYRHELTTSAVAACARELAALVIEDTGVPPEIAAAVLLLVSNRSAVWMLQGMPAIGLINLLGYTADDLMQLSTTQEEATS